MLHHRKKIIKLNRFVWLSNNKRNKKEKGLDQGVTGFENQNSHFYIQKQSTFRLWICPFLVPDAFIFNLIYYLPTKWFLLPLTWELSTIAYRLDIERDLMYVPEKKKPVKNRNCAYAKVQLSNGRWQISISMHYSSLHFNRNFNNFGFNEIQIQIQI